MWEASTSGKAMILRPLRAEHMMAVFSDSTRAIVLSGLAGRRCSPKRQLGELPVFGELTPAFE